jgi:hypothetical protein
MVLFMKQNFLNEKQMKHCSIYNQIHNAKQAGFMPSNWSVSSYDRTQEICQGSQETLM